MKKLSFAVLAMVLTVSIGLSSSSARVTPVGDELLQSLPDGGFVFVANLTQVTGSSFWLTISSQGKIKNGIDELQSELAKAGLRLEDIYSIAAVFPTFARSEPVIAISGAFNSADLLARIRSNPKIVVTSEKYKGFDVYEVVTANQTGAKSGSTSLVFYDSNTAVIGKAVGVRSSIDVRTGAKPGILQNAKLGTAISQNPTSAIRFAAEMTTSTTAGLASGQFPLDLSSVKLIFGTVDVASNIEVNATLRSDSLEPAKAMADQLNGLLGMAKAFLGSSNDPRMAPIAEVLKTVTVSLVEADVKISGNVTPEILSQLLR